MHTERIFEIITMNVHIHKTNPPRLHLSATGNANSGSHSNARLERRVYIVFPEDGIQEYDFVVDVPEGLVTDDIKSHTVEDHWEDVPPQLKGVRVFAKINDMEKTV
jgi:hypothetical protein